ncbi:MAG TPA: HIRAN domain-containing protein [Burkholderiales bacterium]|nr:HIRAN domain-containing protein [Burkholderiales bacterium]
MKAALAAIGFAATIHALPVPAVETFFVVQRSPLAGFRHYDGPEFWREIRAGDRLELVREPENPYDAGAIRVEWRGHKLGYVPQRDNAAIARQMDRGTPLEARVAALRQNRNRSLRIEFEVTAPLQ